MLSLNLDNRPNSTPKASSKGEDEDCPNLIRKTLVKSLGDVESQHSSLQTTHLVCGQMQVE